MGGTGPPEAQARLFGVEHPLSAPIRTEVGGRTWAVARPIPGPVPDPRSGGTLTPHRTWSPMCRELGVGRSGPGAGLGGPCAELLAPVSTPDRV